MKAESRPFRATTYGMIALPIILVCWCALEQSINPMAAPVQAAPVQAAPVQAAPVPAASAPATSVSSAQANLNQSLQSLKLAEKVKAEKPVEYLQALTYTVSAATQLDRELKKHGGGLYSPDGDRYFKLAADFYSKNKWNKNDSDNMASELYRGLADRSPKMVESTFEELFRTSEQHVEGKFERHDLEIYFALSRQEQKLPLPLQLKLLEKAIAIRRLAQKDEVWRIAPLYDDMAMVYHAAGNLPDTERAYLRSIAVLETDPVEQSKSLVNLARYYVDNNMYDKADATWRRAGALTKQKRLAWRPAEWVMLIQTLSNREKPKYIPPIFDLLVTNGDDYTFATIDPLLVDYLDKQIKIGELGTAADLLKKRIYASPGHGAKPGGESWKIQLSNIYLAQGKSAESLSLFKQAISDLVQRGLPTLDYIEARAMLQKNMGIADNSSALQAALPKDLSDIKLPACLVVQDNIDFGQYAQITSFDSSDINDLTLKIRGSGGGMGRPIPSSGDGSAILSLGSISAKDLRYFGVIYCDHPSVTQVINSTAKILPVNRAYKIPDGLQPTANATTVVPNIEANVKMLERGDYILSDLQHLNIREQTSSVPIRIFLQDAPKTNEYALSIQGQPLSYKQFQIWYNGTKTIKIERAQGLIYAPNARVELTSGTGFMGAIVAREFKCAGSPVWLDRAMLNKNLTR